QRTGQGQLRPPQGVGRRQGVGGRGLQRLGPDGPSAPAAQQRHQERHRHPPRLPAFRLPLPGRVRPLAGRRGRQRVRGQRRRRRQRRGPHLAPFGGGGGGGAPPRVDQWVPV